MTVRFFCQNTPMKKLDVLRTVTMLLIHDIVEIDAGDTSCV
ncbi:MAG: HD domain-containing protein [Eubacterium ramulus]